MFAIKKTKEFYQHMVNERRRSIANWNAAKRLSKTEEYPRPITCIDTNIVKDTVQGLDRRFTLTKVDETAI